MVYQYSFAQGSRPAGKVKAQVIGEHLQRIAEREKGSLQQLRPVVIVEDAKDSRSPLHPCFNWNVQEAAEAYWIEQAKYLVRSICVVRVTSDKQPELIRPWVSIKDREDPKPGARVYVPLSSALSREDLRREVLEDAERDWKAYRAKYGHLKELASLMDEGEKIFRKTKRAEAVEEMVLV